jgi:hypothetical protein
MSSIFSPPGRSVRVEWRRPNSRLIERLTARFGAPPHWNVSEIMMAAGDEVVCGPAPLAEGVDKLNED